jgi:hypothetical protein
MKKVKQEGGGGLQEWLSYQSRTRETIQPATDTIDWDDGIQVQEEWLPRELCEQRLREEAERKLTPDSKLVPAASTLPPASTAGCAAASPAPIVAIEDVPLTVAAATAAPQGAPESATDKASVTTSAELAEVNTRDSAVRQFRSKVAAPTQFETDDLVSAMPAFHR